MDNKFTPQVVSVDTKFKTPEDAINNVIDRWNDLEYENLLDNKIIYDVQILRDRFNYIMTQYPDVIIDKYIKVYETIGDLVLNKQ